MSHGRTNRAILVVCGLLCLCTAAGASEEAYAKIVAKQYNGFAKRQEPVEIDITYDSETGHMRFYSPEPLASFAFCLVKAEADTLGERIAKYKRWNRQASSMGVKIEKELGNVYFTCGAWMGDGGWSKGSNLMADVRFFSLSPQVHQLVIVFPTLESVANSADIHVPKALYFGWDSAEELARLIDPEIVAVWSEKQRRQEAVNAQERNQQEAIEAQFK